MLKKIFIYTFILFSLIVIIDGIMFIISQMANIKYYFDDYLSNNNNSIPICEKEFILELILYAKILIVYALYGLFLSIYYIWKKCK